LLRPFQVEFFSRVKGTVIENKDFLTASFLSID
jgi:hypothetical protein